MKMDWFSCNGCILITIDDAMIQATVPFHLQLWHCKPHIVYTNISINETVKMFIEERKRESATNSSVNADEWKLDDNQIKSALKLLECFDKEAVVKIIPIRNQVGVHAIAFSLKEILDRWGDRTEELAMDSTWRTNKAGYKMYGFVGEGNGQSIPFAFLFTTSTLACKDGYKIHMLTDVLQFLKMCCPNIMFMLSDKEVAEIKARLGIPVELLVPS
ncbi:unnamed protein product [Mycena citricolor]|uniref:MULE transposase domain-containing protein n=1 Tax=Mycena citricolor TaxID=2018698 RepID=A0AAD2HXF7_9AGAR|nr:unnamed protein product [Mycena citricolor]